MTREEVIKLVQDSELNEEVKTEWVSLIKEAGLTQEILDGLKDLLDTEIDTQLADLGIDDLPEVKKADDELVAEVEAATGEYVKEMKNIEEEAQAAEVETTAALEKLQADAIKDKIAG